MMDERRGKSDETNELKRIEGRMQNAVGSRQKAVNQKTVNQKAEGKKIERRRRNADASK
jgi:hypothetical protein